MPRLLAFLLWIAVASAETIAESPFVGITHIRRTETSPRNIALHVILIDLTAPGIRFHLTPPGGSRETVRQTTLDFLRQEQAQVAINAHFFLPYPSQDRDAFLIGLAASDGNVFSDFEEPAQSYALLPNAPALNLDSENHAAIVHLGDARTSLWNTLSGSAQIITDGVKTIPQYRPNGPLIPGGPESYSNADSWYRRINARSAIGVTRDGRTLVLFTIDHATVDEVADFLIGDYVVWNALNLDGGGSASLAMEDPVTHVRALVNAAPEAPSGRSVGSSLAVFGAGRK